MARTVVVGDSLGVGTVPHLGGNVKADVRVGRSSSDGVNALSRLVGGADRIVLDLGTNDGSAAQLKQSVMRAVRLAKGKPIYIPTVNGPNAAAKNAVLRQLAGGNVHLVNWAGQSHGLVGPDGIHASPKGYARRAEIIRNAMGSSPAQPSHASQPASQPATPVAQIAQTVAQFADPKRYADMPVKPKPYRPRVSKRSLGF